MGGGSAGLGTGFGSDTDAAGVGGAAGLRVSRNPPRPATAITALATAMTIALRRPWLRGGSTIVTAPTVSWAGSLRGCVMTVSFSWTFFARGIAYAPRRALEGLLR